MARLGHVAPATSTAAMLLGRFATLWFAVAVGFVALFLLRLRYPALAGTPVRSPETTPDAAPPEKTP